MDIKKEKQELMDWLSKLDEPSVLYQISKIKEEAEESVFDFDKEFVNGYTPEEAKAEAHRRIKEWWGK